jgi:hypothetical protein
VLTGFVHRAKSEEEKNGNH